jgi:hypothetical protein
MIERIEHPGTELQVETLTQPERFVNARSRSACSAPRNRIQPPIALDTANAERTGASIRPTSNEIAIERPTSNSAVSDKSAGSSRRQSI